MMSLDGWLWIEYGLTKYKLHWAWQRAALSLAVTVPRLECHIIAAVKYARKKRQKQQCHLQCQRKEVVELSWNGRSQRRTPSSKLCEKLCWILKVCNYFLFQTFFSFHYSSLGTLNPLTTFRYYSDTQWWRSSNSNSNSYISGHTCKLLHYK